MAENITHFAGVKMRVVGAGNLQLAFYSLDKVNSSSMIPVAMSLTSAVEPIRLGNFTSQRALLRGEVTAQNERFQINRILIYAKTVGTALPG